ncbi:hypothetical protein BJ684DRAFT_14466 [Piptocephalis cylindrospora]|uniref:Uncharacterized protein n=1 Tax=Piptocephalis cylindrospora TaxID=1907219 RepID=A0A4V1IYP4_9FUNG|nr:hypothetical protein BJ684DRAFT_14466 [Piptocephalis cylindrospora]|eukprot:RKP15269.1 hypothetical protein BJ684DRAFT_14466 [Piptocephalis cylindrospora]
MPSSKIPNPPPPLPCSSPPLPSIPSLSPAEALERIDAAFEHMDSMYGASFRDFLRDPTTAAYCAQRIRPLTQSMDLATTATGLRYLLGPWPTTARVTFLRTLFHDAFPEAAGALYAAILWPTERGCECASVEVVALAAGILLGTPLPSAILFLWVWRRICGLDDIHEVVRQVGSILRWDPADLHTAHSLLQSLDVDRRYGNVD